MSLQVSKSEQHFERLSSRTSDALGQDKRFKVLIPYDGSQNAEIALDDLRRAGLPQALDAMVAVTNVWLPLSPYEITRAVSARRMKVLTAGVSSFTPARRNDEEQQVLSLDAKHRIRSIFPSGTVMTEAIRDTATVASDILRKAKKWGAELIIIGSGNSPSPYITDYAGPAVRVAREADCSIRIAREFNRKDDSPIRIIIGIDRTDSTARVIQAVAHRVWPLGSEARLVAVHKSGPRDPEKASETALALEQSAEKLRVIGLRVSSTAADGNPQEVLMQLARELSADCIFLDAHGLNQGLDNAINGGALGSVAEAVALGAHCSVEIVRQKNLSDQYIKPVA